MKSNQEKALPIRNQLCKGLQGKSTRAPLSNHYVWSEYLKREIREESHSLMQKHLLHPLKEFRLCCASTKRLLTTGAVGKSYPQLRGMTDCSEENQMEERRKPPTQQSRFDLPAKFLSNLTLLNSSPPRTCN